MLGLERKRLEKDCYFHLLTTTTGSSIVDTHRWHRNLKFKGTTNATARRRQCETIDFETEHDFEIEVTKITDVLCKIL